MPADLHRQLRDEQRLTAHNVLNKAVAAGTVVRPSACELCGRKPERQSSAGTAPSRHPLSGHHENYGKPLEVIWLCMSCHGRLHFSGGLAAYADDLRRQLMNAGRLLAQRLADKETQ